MYAAHTLDGQLDVRPCRFMISSDFAKVVQSNTLDTQETKPRMLAGWPLSVRRCLLIELTYGTSCCSSVLISP